MKNKSKHAFTVLETIISIAVLSAVIGGISNVIRTNISALSIAKEEVRAFYLAEEAVEMIRNRRDGNELDSLFGGSSDWLAGMATSGDPCQPGKTCMADAYTNSLTYCGLSWGTCPVLKQDTNPASTSYLVHGYGASWTDTPYKREIQIETISATEISITVQISWNHGAVSKSFKTKTTLNNWF